MSIKILFLNTCHFSYDDRVFYHQAESLSNYDHEIMIVSTKENIIKNEGNISINSFDARNLTIRERKIKILEYLTIFAPEIIICDSPLAVISANSYRKIKKSEIIYDITEWYPSKKNLRNLYFLKKTGKFAFLILVNLYAGLISDKFIFGEYHKSIPFRKLFFWKQSLILPYYPNLKFIQRYDINRIDREIKLFYSGNISTEKGIDSIINSIDKVSKLFPQTFFHLRIIGQFPTKIEEQNFKNITSELNSNVEIHIDNFMPFRDYCNEIGKSDLFFDLRQIDIENTHCLPIKLFYYLACGKPIIYSNLKSIRKGIENINFGFLTDPNNSIKIASFISDYINNPDLYKEHARNALLESHNKYNWKKIENSFISFLATEKQ